MFFFQVKTKKKTAYWQGQEICLCQISQLQNLWLLSKIHLNEINVMKQTSSPPPLKQHDPTVTPNSFIQKIRSMDNERVSYFKIILKIVAIFGINVFFTNFLFPFLFPITFLNDVPTNVPIAYRHTSYFVELHCHVEKFQAAVRL